MDDDEVALFAAEHLSRAPWWELPAGAHLRLLSVLCYDTAQVRAAGCGAGMRCGRCAGGISRVPMCVALAFLHFPSRLLRADDFTHHSSPCPQQSPLFTTRMHDPGQGYWLRAEINARRTE